MIGPWALWGGASGVWARKGILKSAIGSPQSAPGDHNATRIRNEYKV